MLNKIKSLFTQEQKSIGNNVAFLNWDTLQMAEDTEWNYYRNSFMGYMSNPIVYRAINMRSDAVSGVPWKLYRKLADNRDVEIETAPVLDLLKKPNPWCAEKDFFAQYMQYMDLSGNAYIREAGPTHGPPRELYLLRPDRIFINYGSGCSYTTDNGFVYEYRCGRETEKLDPRTFYHDKYFNPICDRYGLSPLAPARSSIEQINEALRWNVSLLRNSASPSGMLAYEGNLTDNQIKRLKEESRSKHQGFWNAGSVFIGEGGLKWIPVGLSPKDMDWLKGFSAAIKNIYLNMGIDPSLGGDSEHKTYNTFRDAEKSFYTATVIPLLEKIRDGFLNSWLLPKFNMGDNVYFNFDVDSIECLSEQRSEIWKRMLDGVKGGIITINEAREELGYSEMAEESLDEVDQEEENERDENEEETDTEE